MQKLFMPLIRDFLRETAQRIQKDNAGRTVLAVFFWTWWPVLGRVPQLNQKRGSRGDFRVASGNDEPSRRGVFKPCGKAGKRIPLGLDKKEDVEQ
jgi:hypothetical protein